MWSGVVTARHCNVYSTGGYQDRLLLETAGIRDSDIVG